MVKIDDTWYGKTATAKHFDSAQAQCATEFGAESSLASVVTAAEFEAVKSALNFYKGNFFSRKVKLLSKSFYVL